MTQATIAELQAELAAMSEKLGPETVVNYWVLPIKPDVLKRVRHWQAAFDAQELAKNKSRMAGIITRYSEKASPSMAKEMIELLLAFKAVEERVGDWSFSEDPEWIELQEKKELLKNGITEKVDVIYWSRSFNTVGRLGRTMTLKDMEEVMTDVFNRRAA